MALKIYLAGKMVEDEYVSYEGDSAHWQERVEAAWRKELLVEGYKHGESAAVSFDEITEPWKVTPRAVLGLYDYTGPYYFGEGHGIAGGKEHGWTTPISTRASLETWIVAQCRRAICESDVVFAWIDRPDSFGTFVELGYAHAHGKRILIAGPERFRDMWFVYQIADLACFGNDPVAALGYLLWESGLERDPREDLCESPIEKAFFQAARNRLRDLQVQVPIGPYRADFVLPAARMVIELDGHDSHKTKEQRTHDAKRERYLKREGWEVIRFTGSEVHRDVEACVREVEELIAVLQAA